VVDEQVGLELLSKRSFLPNAGEHGAYGNLHFTLTPRLADSRDRERYAAFMADLVTLIIDKAVHCIECGLRAYPAPRGS
jgi:hypothetical protein